MGIFRKAEKKLEGLVEGGFGRAFKASVQPVELAHKLAKEMGDHKTVGVSNVYVPNEFDIYLGEADYGHLSSLSDSLKTELANYVDRLRAARGLDAGGAAAHRPAPRRRPARRRVRHRHAHGQRAAEAPGADVRPPLAAASPRGCSGPAARPDRAVPGAPPARPSRPRWRAPGVSRASLRGPQGQWELREVVTVIGRSRRCDIVLTDPNVSRQHAEIRRQDDGFMVRRPRFHQRHAREPARRQAGRAAARRPHRTGHHRARCSRGCRDAGPQVNAAAVRVRPRRLRETPMIDIVLLVLKIGILVLLYLFIWQVVKTRRDATVRAPAGVAAAPDVALPDGSRPPAVFTPAEREARREERLSERTISR